MIVGRFSTGDQGQLCNAVIQRHGMQLRMCETKDSSRFTDMPTA
jgi:hypothetical protein